MLGRRVKSRRPRPESLQELRRALGEEWELIPQEDIANQIESMPRRMDAVIQEREGENPQTIRQNTGILLEASKAIGLEVNPENTKYMIVSRDENVVRNGNIKIGNLSFEEVEKLKYLGATVTNINDIREEIKHRINMGNACFYSVEKLLSSSLLSKNLKFKSLPEAFKELGNHTTSSNKKTNHLNVFKLVFCFEVINCWQINVDLFLIDILWLATPVSILMVGSIIYPFLVVWEYAMMSIRLEEPLVARRKTSSSTIQDFFLKEVAVLRIEHDGVWHFGEVNLCYIDLGRGQGFQSPGSYVCTGIRPKSDQVLL
ncbi:hypothetical protein ANN_16235 [Periplaneta americana]|uniref:Uncharacterized protein n=1 Tax=Periplaneta americana TaxID=6978 RepID=A0ABQ8SJE1_PERAM|nr:hypothetical protein ANN_16235 [Periplaneta americana]